MSMKNFRASEMPSRGSAAKPKDTPKAKTKRGSTSTRKTKPKTEESSAPTPASPTFDNIEEEVSSETTSD